MRAEDRIAVAHESKWATNYRTEPQGDVAAITEAQGNITSASYNGLGQRTQEQGPDRIL